MDFLHSVLPSLTGREEVRSLSLECLSHHLLVSDKGLRLKFRGGWNTLILYLILQVAGSVLQNTLLKVNSEPSNWPGLSAQQSSSLWAQ